MRRREEAREALETGRSRRGDCQTGSVRCQSNGKVEIRPSLWGVAKRGVVACHDKLGSR